MRGGRGRGGGLEHYRGENLPARGESVRRGSSRESSNLPNLRTPTDYDADVPAASCEDGVTPTLLPPKPPCPSLSPPRGLQSTTTTTPRHLSPVPTMPAGPCSVHETEERGRGCVLEKNSFCVALTANPARPCR